MDLDIPGQVEDFLVGAIGGTLSDLVIDIPLSKMGAFYTVTITDKQGAWIWGFGTGDLINTVLGVAMWSGVLEDYGVPSLTGLGWLTGLGIAKISELYNPIQRYFNITADRNWNFPV